MPAAVPPAPAAPAAPRSGPAPARPGRTARTPPAEGTNGDPAKGEVRGTGAEVKTARHSTFEIHPSHFASLPGQLLYSTQIPVYLCFIGKDAHAGKTRAPSELELAVAP